MVALEGQDIQASGRVSGTLPVVMDDQGVSIVDGSIAAAVPGGLIRLAESLSRSVNQPGIDFALRALEDFHFRSLEAKVGYTAAGDLTAAVALKGANPAIEGGRQIHYNLNITENVPVLLESLRLQDEVTSRVEKKVRARSGQKE